MIPFLPPAIEGVGAFGGFQYILEDQGGHSLDELAKVTHDVVAPGQRERQGLRGLFSSFTANDPQFVVTIDREKTKALRVPFSQVTETLQIYMGSAYVNDFDFNNRSYRVYVQAATGSSARSRGTCASSTCARRRARWSRSTTWCASSETTTPGVISPLQPVPLGGDRRRGGAGPELGPGDRRPWTSCPARSCRRASPTNGPGSRSRSWSRQAPRTILFGLGTLVVYLTLAAQYESFVLPFIVLLAVPMAMLGALGAQWLRGLQNDVYCQIGLVMLVGLSPARTRS